MKHRNLTNFSWAIIFLWGILAEVDGISIDEIQSTGVYASQDFTWARNISSLTFSFRTLCPDFNKSCGRTWEHNFENPAQTVQISYWYGSCVPVTKPDYTGDCLPVRGTSFVDFTLQILFPLPRNTTLLVKNSTTPSVDNVTLTVKNCPPLKPYDYVKLSDSSGAAFQDTRTYSCNTTLASALFVDGDTIHPNQTYQRTCQFDATWSGTENIQCYFGPSPELSLNPDNKPDYLPNDPLNLTCKGLDTGNPTNATPIFFLQLDNSDKEKVSSTLVINYTMHGANILCKGINKYVELINDQAGFSDSRMLNVSFGPVPLIDESGATRSPALSTKASLLFKFAANPPVKHTSLHLNFSSDTGVYYSDLNISSNSLETNQQNQVYNHTIQSVISSNYGRYILTVNSEDNRFGDPLYMEIRLVDPSKNDPITGTTDRVTSIATSTISSNVTTVGPPIGLIVGASVAGVVLIVLVVVGVMLIWKRQNTTPDKSAKEEKLNPIYGSSAGPSNEQNGGKEERNNPLYKSSDGGGLEIEEAYGAVNSKKGKKGTENTAFSPEVTEVTYAAVNKPKKNKNAEVPQEAVYSAVDKKKKKKDPDSEPGLHGSPVH